MRVSTSGPKRCQPRPGGDQTAANRTAGELSRRRLFLSAAAAGLAACGPGTSPERRPNVILLITDDQGYGDLGCHGNSMIRTPHIDRLHSESVRFTDFHVDPLCAPTRAALMTGRYAYRAGVTAAFAGRSILRRDETTMAEIFRANGYRTGLFGKWHLGDNYPFRPNERVSTRPSRLERRRQPKRPTPGATTTSTTSTRATNVPEKIRGLLHGCLLPEGLKFAEESGDQPFFLFLPLNAPHSPYLVDPKYSRPYEEQGIPPTRAAFYGMIENIDENVGRLRARLDELGLSENTIFIS